MFALAAAIVLAMFGSSFQTIGTPSSSKLTTRVLTPLCVIAEAESLLEREPIIVRLRVGNVDTVPIITEAGRTTTEARLHPVSVPSFDPVSRASFYVGVSPKAHDSLRNLGIDLFEHFRGKIIEVEGRLHMASKLLVRSEPYVFWHLLVDDLDEVRIVDPDEPTPIAASIEPPDAESGVARERADDVWKENYAVEYPGSLPVSVAFSADGVILLTGDTSGEVMALEFGKDEAHWRWRASIQGSHAAVAFSADQETVYATTEHGVRILDAARGKDVGRLEEKDSNPTSIGVLPQRKLAEQYTRRQIVFGTPRGYFVKSWVDGKLPDSVGTLGTSTVAEGNEPADAAAVPLAVDPKGRSAIMTGPIDPTGAAGGGEGSRRRAASADQLISPGAGLAAASGERKLN